MSTPFLLENDAHDAALRRHTAPPDWQNPRPAGRYNLVVVGGGTAGLVAAAGAAGLGGRVALVERRLLGGDCLNFGCVPSKALLHAARTAHAVRSAGAAGVEAGEARVDFARVMERVRAVRARIAPHDSAARFASLGVDVFLGDGVFVAPDALEVAGARLTFARALVATGGRAALPPVPGLADVPYLTNETVFTLTRLPRRLLVLGAGPIGCELAQAFRRLGAEVLLVDAAPALLPREDADAGAVVRARLEAEGVQLHLGVQVLRAEAAPTGEVRLWLERAGAQAALEGDALLVATGRTPEVEGLGLEAAGVRAGPKGVEVDDTLRTSNPRIYAAGDVCSRFQFTHAADALARVALQNALFFGRRRASALTIPWCTYTDPEVAHVGLTAEDARAAGPRVVTLTQPMAGVDRALLEGEEEGFGRLHVDARSGRILGGTLVGPQAGESIAMLALAVGQGLTAGQLGSTVLPYPTRTEVLKRLGDAWNRRRLTPRAHRLLSGVLKWRR